MLFFELQLYSLALGFKYLLKDEIYFTNLVGSGMCGGGL